MRILSATRPLAGVCLLFCLGLTACRDNPMADAFRRVTGLGLTEPGVVATVNGRPVLLRQVEALADMSAPVMAQAQSSDLNGLWADYADSLYRLTIQYLVRQELDARGLEVDTEEMTRVEAMISAGYRVPPGQEFSTFLEELGFDPEAWRQQIRARLEQELWERELLKNYAPDLADMEDYLARNPDLAVSPDLYEFIVVEGVNRRLLEQRRGAGEKETDRLYEDGFEVSRQRRSLRQSPEIWRADLTGLEPGEVSGALRRIDGAIWGYLILLDKVPERQRVPAELYSLAETAVSRQALPELYDAWLTEALARAEIRVAEQFLPENVPERVYGRNTIFPWESDADGESADALGEVEGEVEESAGVPALDEEGAQ